MLVTAEQTACTCTGSASLTFGSEKPHAEVEVHGAFKFSLTNIAALSPISFSSMFSYSLCYVEI